MILYFGYFPSQGPTVRVIYPFYDNILLTFLFPFYSENKPEAKRLPFFNSPSELFAARSRSHKIPVRGQKDFFPDDSDKQKQQLEQSLKEHWSLLSEERVERLWVASDIQAVSFIIDFSCVLLKAQPFF